MLKDIDVIIQPFPLNTIIAPFVHILDAYLHPNFCILGGYYPNSDLSLYFSIFKTFDNYVK